MKQKFRSLPLRQQPDQVDREQRVLYGVSAAQAVEALGHNLMLDGKTLEQIVVLGNGARNGIKSRFTHPGLSSDGMGKLLGRMKNFRIEGDKAIGDLHLAQSASKAPDGDLAGYVMDLADEDSEAFGMSIVAGGYTVWTLDDGTEIATEEYWDDDEAGYRPENATTSKPVFRVEALDAVDVVDEPAANRDGMFSGALWGTNQLAESMFGDFDALLKQVGMSPEQAWGYALKYFDARGVDFKRVAMTEEQTVVEPQGNETEQDSATAAAVEIENEGDEEVTQEEMKALQAELADLRGAREQAQQLQSEVDAMKREARNKRFAELAKSWQGETAKHLLVLEALGEGSDAYTAYCTHMDALSAQIQTGGLFSEVGRNPKVATGSAAERLNAKAQEIATSEKVSFAKAMELAAQRNPALYQEHVAEMRGE